MKRKIITLLCAAAVIASLICLASCGKWETPYGDLDGKGYTVSVKFDANGGTFAGTNDVFVIDVFNPADAKTGADGKKEIQLIPPDDEGRGYGTFEVSRNQYFLAGWYTDRTPRVDESGQSLDDYGIPTSVSGNPQGYVYSGRWDFQNDRVRVDASDASLSSESPYLTLYAAWIPYFNFEIYSCAEGGEQLIGTVSSTELSIPEWNKKTGKLDMGNFPSVEGMTFDGAFADSALSESISGKISGGVDYERGICLSGGTVKIYSTWLEGEWYKVYTAEQFVKNSRPNGNYIICNDLDFTDEIWSMALSKGKFSGTIEGNGHTLTGINVTQVDGKQLTGGIFGALDAGAVIRDVKIENASFTIDTGSVMTGATFGLLAGSLSSDATLEGVSVDGTLYISSEASLAQDPRIGLLFGNGGGNVDLSGIKVEIIGDNADGLSVTYDGATGQVFLSFAQ